MSGKQCSNLAPVIRGVIGDMEELHTEREGMRFLKMVRVGEVRSDLPVVETIEKRMDVS